MNLSKHLKLCWSLFFRSNCIKADQQYGLTNSSAQHAPAAIGLSTESEQVQEHEMEMKMEHEMDQAQDQERVSPTSLSINPTPGLKRN